FGSHARAIFISLRSGNGAYIAKAGCGQYSGRSARGSLSTWGDCRTWCALDRRNIYPHWLGKRIGNQSGTEDREENSWHHFAPFPFPPRAQKKLAAPTSPPPFARQTEKKTMPKRHHHPADKDAKDALECSHQNGERLRIHCVVVTNEPERCNPVL